MNNQLFSSSTGDIHKNIESLRNELRTVKCPLTLNEEHKVSMRRGEATILIDILEYALLKYSPLVKAEALEAPGGADLRSEASDQAFLSAVFRVLRHQFTYHPVISVTQFLSSGFAERKIIICQDVLKLVKSFHHKLQKETLSGIRRPVNQGSRLRDHSPALSISSQASSRHVYSADNRRPSSARDHPLRSRCSRGGARSRTPPGSPSSFASGPATGRRLSSIDPIFSKEKGKDSNETMRRVSSLEEKFEILAHNTVVLISAMTKDGLCKDQNVEFALSEIKMCLANDISIGSRTVSPTFPAVPPGSTLLTRGTTLNPPKKDRCSNQLGFHATHPPPVQNDGLSVSFQGPYSSEIFLTSNPNPSLTTVDSLLQNLQQNVVSLKEKKHPESHPPPPRSFPGIFGSPLAPIGSSNIGLANTSAGPVPPKKKFGALETPAFGRGFEHPPPKGPSLAAVGEDRVATALTNTRQWMEDLEKMHERFRTTEDVLSKESNF